MFTKRVLTVVLVAGVALLALLGTRPDAAVAALQNAPAGGKETHAPAAGTSLLTIPAAAFEPYEDGYDYFRITQLAHFHSPGGGNANGWYLAPVNLPQGSQVTKFTFNWYDWMGVDGMAKLQWTHLGFGDFIDMAAAATTGSAGYGSSSDDSIGFSFIENAQCAYWVVWDLPATAPTPEMGGISVVIEYIPPATNTGVLSIPAAAFTPYEDGYDYQNDGRFLKHFHSPGGGNANGWYLAPVNLPHGAVVKSLMFHWYDNASTNGIAKLQRTQLGAGDFVDMAAAATAGSAGYGSSYDDTIGYASIDNTWFAYWVVWDLPVSDKLAMDMAGVGVVIKYTLPATQMGILSIPAAAFTAEEDGYDYQNDARYLRHFHSPGGGTEDGYYYAPVYLPQGATVTSMTFCWYDASATKNGEAELWRSSYYGYEGKNMATTSSTGSSGYGKTADATISYSTVDNSQYTYSVQWRLPAVENVMGCGVVIHYEYRLYLPVLRR